MIALTEQLIRENEELAAIANKFNQLQSSIAAQQTVKDNVEQKIESFKTKLSELKDEYNEIKQQQANSEDYDHERLEQLVAEMAEVEVNIASWQNALREVYSKLEELQGEKSQVEELLNSSQSTVETHTQELEELKAQLEVVSTGSLDDITKNLEKAQNEQAGLVQEVATLTAEKTAKENYIEKLNQAISMLSSLFPEEDTTDNPQAQTGDDNTTTPGSEENNNETPTSSPADSQETEVPPSPADSQETEVPPSPADSQETEVPPSPEVASDGSN